MLTVLEPMDIIVTLGRSIHDETMSVPFFFLYSFSFSLLYLLFFTRRGIQSTFFVRTPGRYFFKQKTNATLTLG